MNRRLAIVGIVVTLLYLGLGGAFVWGRLTELQKLPLNELGDFMAGAFGPLAIFWLVLGFFQQGDELRLNTDALHLQAKELQHSVDQQKALVNLAREEHEERRVKAQPNFVLQGAQGGQFGIGSTKIRLTVHISNFGVIATEVRLSFDPELPSAKPVYFKYLSTGADVAQFEFVTRGEHLPFTTRITMSCTDSLGNLAATQFWMTVARNPVNQNLCSLEVENCPPAA